MRKMAMMVKKKKKKSSNRSSKVSDGSGKKGTRDGEALNNISEYHISMSIHHWANPEEI